MTILEDNKRINQLITKGYYDVKELDGDHIYKYTLENGYIMCDGFLGDNNNTLDKRLDSLSFTARRAYFIQEVLKSVGINIPDIETNYHVLISLFKTWVVFLKYADDEYTYIQLFNNEYLDYSKNLCVYKLNMKTNKLIFDRIDFEELKYYHKESEISKYTLNCIKNKWIKKGYYSHNDLYDVFPIEFDKEDGSFPNANMYEYGDYICDLDIDKLDKNICEIETLCSGGKYYRHEKPKIYFL